MSASATSSAAARKSPGSSTTNVKWSKFATLRRNASSLARVAFSMAKSFCLVFPIPLPISSRLGTGNSVPAVECHRILVLDTFSPEDVQGRANRQINGAAAEARDFLQILERIGPAGVSRRNRRPLRQVIHKFIIHTPAKTLDIDRVHQKLVAPFGQPPHRFCAQRNVREVLPAIRHDEVLVAALAAA